MPLHQMIPQTFQPNVFLTQKYIYEKKKCMPVRGRAMKNKTHVKYTGTVKRSEEMKINDFSRMHS